MKTLADLKRDAKSGKYALELIYRFGSPIPINMQGIRRLVNSNSRAVMLQLADGRTSELVIPSAKLIEYTEETLSVYNPGERPLTAEEEAIINKTTEIYKANEYTGSGGFYQVRAFLAKSTCPWLAGNEKIQGKYYNLSSKTILDDKLRGDMILQYRVIVLG